MKKLISLVLTVSLAFGVFACSKKDPADLLSGSDVTITISIG